MRRNGQKSKLRLMKQREKKREQIRETTMKLTFQLYVTKAVNFSVDAYLSFVIVAAVIVDIEVDAGGVAATISFSTTAVAQLAFSLLLDKTIR